MYSKTNGGVVHIYQLLVIPRQARAGVFTAVVISSSKMPLLNSGGKSAEEHTTPSTPDPHGSGLETTNRSS